MTITEPAELFRQRAKSFAAERDLVDNKIRLFPCWPADKDAAFTRLRAQGGFLVSAEFKQGKVVSATIESLAGKELQLLSPWPTIYVNGSKQQIGPKGLVKLDSRPGEVFHITETQVGRAANQIGATAPAQKMAAVGR